MSKKLWIGFIAVYVVMMITNFIIHEGLLSSTYHSDEMMKFMRPEAEGKLWIHFVTTLFASFFFTLIFSKGYEGKGIPEGLRYGFYIGMFSAIPMAYDTYAAMTIPYSLALQWFVYGMIQYMVLGVTVAMVFGKGSQQPATA